jgi:TPR repeat protein
MHHGIEEPLGNLKSILADQLGDGSLSAMQGFARFSMMLVLVAGPHAVADGLPGILEQAEKGELAAQVELARIYQQGEGVAKDPGTAAKWLLKAAQQGDTNSQSALGQALLHGDGLPVNVSEGIKWLTQAAEQGNGQAQMVLGGLYVSGKSVKKNSIEAAKWFMMSAQQGNPSAQAQAARMHMTGAGVPKDDVEAYKWAHVAAAQGDSAAKKILAFLEQRMTPAQISDGQGRSRNFTEGKRLEKTLDAPVEPIPVQAAEPEPAANPEPSSEAPTTSAPTANPE